MTDQNKLTTQEFWVPNENGVAFVRHDNHGIDALIKQYIPETTAGSCIEIGSYPGPFLSTFGDLGYTLNGIDFHPDNAIGLPAWLQSEGYKTNQFLCVDFFEFKPKQQYDVVASFGFIEHFVDYKSVINTHATLVKENGYLIITTPNFKGKIQHWLHRHFDKSNLALHNIKSMSPS
ncbi:MAG: class I SAM-dependent methyltransferase, partial [Sphingobacteriales bacterium]